MTWKTLFSIAESFASQQLFGIAVASTLLCVVALVISKALTNRSAAFRFWIWQSVGHGVLLASLLLFATTGVPLRAVQETDATASLTPDTTENRTLSLVAPISSAPFIEESTQPQPNTHETIQPPTHSPALALPADSKPALTTSNLSDSGAITTQGETPTIPMTHWLALGLVALWGLGFLWKLIGLAVGITRCYWLIGQSKPIQHAELQRQVAQASNNDSATKRIKLLSSDRVEVPFAIGILSPKIVIPTDLLSWPKEKLEMIVSHELAHIHRSDILWHWLNQVACCLAWFNPLMWMAVKNGILERERACDDLVLETGVAPVEYGESLVDVASMMAAHQKLACAVSMAEPPLKERLRAILDSERKSNSSSFRVQAFTMTMLISIAMGAGLFRPLATAEVPAPSSLDQPLETIEVKGGNDDDKEEAKTKPTNEAPELSKSFQGKVLTHDGKPAVNVFVDLQIYGSKKTPEGKQEFNVFTETTVTTDDEGRYSVDTSHLKDVSKGAVIAINRVHHPTIVEGRRGGWRAFSVKDGNLPDYQLSKGRLIKGQILDTNRQPLKAIVKSCGANQNPNKAWFPQGIETLNDGTFQFMAPIDHQIELLVIAEGHLPHRIAVPGNKPEALLHFDGGPMTPEAIQKLDETGIPENEVDENQPFDAGQVVMTKGNPIKGKVLDKNGNPLAGVLVVLDTANTSKLDSIAFEAQFATYSDQEGNFELPPGIGNSHVLVSERAYVSNRIRDREIKGPAVPAIASVPLLLDKNSAFNDVLLKALPETVRVSGNIKFDNGEPAVGVEVVGGATPGQEFAKVNTDEHGNYEIEMPSPLENAFVRVIGAKDERGVWHIAAQDLENGSGGQYSQLMTLLAEDIDDLNWTLRELKSYGFEESIEYTKARKEFRKLEQLRQQIYNTFVREESNAVSDEEKERIYMELDPRNAMAKHYLDFEEKHRGKQAAFLAIKAGMSSAVSVGNPETKASKCRNEMVARLLKHYLDHKDLSKTFDSLHGGPLVEQRDKILEMARKHSPHRRVRGEAILYQVDFALRDLRFAERLPRIRKFVEQQLSQMPKQMADSYRIYLKQLEQINQNALRGKALLWVDVLEQEYGDVRVDTQGTYYGLKLGLISKQLRYVLENVRAGHLAPEIEGTDITGTPFRLSESKGKPVVLIFAHQIFPGEIYGQDLAAKFVDDEVEFLTIVGASKVDESREKIVTNKFHGTVMLEPISWSRNGYRAKWLINTQTIFAIDKQGVLVGEMEEENLEEWLNEQRAQ